MESLRDIGYSLDHAVADIIDNSISAGATEVELETLVGPSSLELVIRDNGSGMGLDELLQAMRLGSRNPKELRDSTDLGRFGLGLKTASFSQCRRLEVHTRKNGKSISAVWDLDHVANTNRWDVLLPDKEYTSEALASVSGDGTVVIWKAMDRVATLPLTPKTITNVTELFHGVRRHLEVVFHRFLDGSGSGRQIVMKMNGRPLVAFDPFWSSHPLTKITPSPPEVIPYRDGTVSIQAFTLPHHSKVSKTDWQKHGGPGGYVSNQGFYLYRARRLLVWGTWFGLDRKRAVNQLCRVRIDVDNSYDEDWKVDIKKSRAKPPRVIRDRLEVLMDRLTKDTRRIYRRRGQKLVNASSLPFWERHHDDDGFRYEPSLAHPVIARFRETLPDDLVPQLDLILAMLGASLPFASIFSDIGDEPQSLISTMQAEESLAAARSYHDALISKGFPPTSALAALRASGLFDDNWSMIEQQFSETEDMQEKKNGSS